MELANIFQTIDGWPGLSMLETLQLKVAATFSDQGVKAEFDRQGAKNLRNLTHSAAVIGAATLLDYKFAGALGLISGTEQVSFLLNEAPGQSEEKRETYAIAWARKLIEVNPDSFENLLSVFLDKSREHTARFLNAIMVEAADLLYEDKFDTKAKEVSDASLVSFFLNDAQSQNEKMREVYALVCALGMIAKNPDSFGKSMEVLAHKSPRASLRLSTIYLTFIV